METEKYKTSKTIELPVYGMINHEKGHAVFKLSHVRRFKYGPKDEDYFDLEDNEVFYETIFGWGVIIDATTMRLSRPMEGTPFTDGILIPIYEDQYGDGTF